MRPLKAYVGPCQELTVEGLARAFPWPFLVHSSLASGSLARPANATLGVTMDRLIVPDQLPAAAPRSLIDAFTVFEVRSRTSREAWISIGCARTCDLVINHASISRIHAYIEGAGDACRLVDNESAAGTRVNEELLEPEARRPLAIGDRITLGEVDLLFLGASELHTLVHGLVGIPTKPPPPKDG